AQRGDYCATAPRNAAREGLHDVDADLDNARHRGFWVEAGELLNDAHQHRVKASELVSAAVLEHIGERVHDGNDRGPRLLDDWGGGVEGLGQPGDKILEPRLALRPLERLEERLEEGAEKLVDRVLELRSLGPRQHALEVVEGVL